MTQIGKTIKIHENVPEPRRAIPIVPPAQPTPVENPELVPAQYT